MTTPDPGTGASVLIVDDDVDVRETLKEVLELEGFRTVSVTNGREALAALDGLPRPAVMLLDLRMPVMDGWQTIDALRAQRRVDEVPIVICTSAPRDAPEGFPVLSKPLELERLVVEILRRAR
jgi:CheY-like chemotaxis protein